MANYTYLYTHINKSTQKKRVTNASAWLTLNNIWNILWMCRSYPQSNPLRNKLTTKTHKMYIHTYKWLLFGLITIPSSVQGIGIWQCLKHTTMSAKIILYTPCTVKRKKHLSIILSWQTNKKIVTWNFGCFETDYIQALLKFHHKLSKD